MFGMTLIGAMLLAGGSAPLPAERLTKPFDSETTTRSTDASADAPADTVAVETDLTQRMTVSVNIDGRGPFAFLVDTGSERTAISRQLATRLNLSDGAPARIHSVLGAGTVATVHIPGLSVGRQALSVVNAPTFEARHMGADGMLGVDSLRSQRVMFDFKAGEMRITPSRYKEPATVEQGTIVVRARKRNGRLILTDVELDGVKIAAIIDTGSQVSIGNLALLRRLQSSGGAVVEARAGEADRRGVIEAVTGEVKDVELFQVKRLNLGGVELQGVGVAFADAHIFKELGYENRPALLLGIDAMRAFDKVSIDFARKKVRFVLPGIGMIEGYKLAAR